MFEQNVDKYILQDSLKIALDDYLKKNFKKSKVKKGLKGKTGHCIENSVNYDSKRISIGFAVFNGKYQINTMNIIIHAVNYDKKGKLIDNTNIKEKYDFYEIEKICSTDCDKIRNEMIRIVEEFKLLAIENLKVLYGKLEIGGFNFIMKGL